MPGERITDQPPGPASDAEGRTSIDPTQNVKEYVALQVQRLDDLHNANTAHAKESAELRSSHARELRVIETARLDAIRNVDNVAVQRAAEVSAAQAQALAQTLAQTAEAMRTQVAAAATATATALDAKIAPIQAAIGDLQRFQFEAVGGKSQVIETQSRSGSLGLWVGIAATAVFGFLSLLIAAGSLVFALTR